MLLRVVAFICVLLPLIGCNRSDTKKTELIHYVNGNTQEVSLGNSKFNVYEPQSEIEIIGRDVDSYNRKVTDFHTEFGVDTTANKEFSGNSDNYSHQIDMLLTPVDYLHKRDVDSLALRWLMYGDNAAIKYLNNHVNNHAFIYESVPEDASPVEMLALLLFINDISKTHHSFFQEETNPELNNFILHLIDSLETIKGVQLRKLRESIFEEEREIKPLRYVESLRDYKLKNEEMRTLKVLSGNKTDLSDMLNSREASTEPERIALYLYNAAKMTNSPSLMGKGAMLMLRRLPSNCQYLPAAINLLDKAIANGDSISLKRKKLLSNNLKSIMGTN